MHLKKNMPPELANYSFAGVIYLFSSVAAKKKFGVIIQTLEGGPMVSQI